MAVVNFLRIPVHYNLFFSSLYKFTFFSLLFWFCAKSFAHNLKLIFIAEPQNLSSSMFFFLYLPHFVVLKAKKQRIGSFFFNFIQLPPHRIFSFLSVLYRYALEIITTFSLCCHCYLFFYNLLVHLQWESILNMYLYGDIM